MELLVYIAIGAVVVLILMMFLFRKSLGAFFRFLVSKLFLINLVIACAVAVYVPYCSIQSLDDYTNHGIKVETPYLIGTHISELDSKLEGLDLVVVIDDSTYSDDYPAGTVMWQHPNPKFNYDSVKPGRTIHLSIVKKGGEYITVPDLGGDIKKSKTLARIQLETRGFKVEFETVQSKDANVIRAEYKNKPITKGAKILKGETIKLIVGSGASGVGVNLPSVKGMTVLQANQAIVGAGLNFQVSYDTPPLTAEDSSSYIITGQNPSPGSVQQGIVQTGSTVVVFASQYAPQPEAPEGEGTDAGLNHDAN